MRLEGIRIGTYEIVVWDFAGQPRSHKLWRLYFRGSRFAVSHGFYCAPRWHYDSNLHYSFDAPGSSYAYIGPMSLRTDQLWLLDLEASGGIEGNIELFITDPNGFTLYQSSWSYL